MKHTATNSRNLILSFILAFFCNLSLAAENQVTFARTIVDGQEEQANKPAITNQQQLAKVVSQIKDKSTRLQALSTLFDCASRVLYQNSGNMQLYPDAKTRKLHEDAAQAMRKASDNENLKLMLLSSNEKLQGWAVFAISKKNAELVPILKEVVARDKFDWRDLAVEKLQLFPDTEPFIKQYLTTTKDAWVLLKQLHNEKEFNRRILALLSDKDQTTRITTLNFIGGNKNSAEMFHKDFDKLIFDQALKLSSSTSAEERSAALSAVISLRNFDDNATFNLLTHAYKDTSSDVRGRVALALKFYKPEQTAGMLKTLLADTDEQVLFSAIISDGVDKHKAEMEKLCHSKDELTATMAKSWLEGMSKAK